MCKCACLKWFKKIFGLKKNCCCSAEEKKDTPVIENISTEPVADTVNHDNYAPATSQEPVVETPVEEERENFEQK